MSDMSDDEVTHWMVYDGSWIFKEGLDTDNDRFDECFQNHETFETLEEAQAEYNRRTIPMPGCSYGYDTIRLEECGGGIDDSYPIDTIEYWERCTIEEFKKEYLAKQ